MQLTIRILHQLFLASPSVTDLLREAKVDPSARSPDKAVRDRARYIALQLSLACLYCAKLSNGLHFGR